MELIIEDILDFNEYKYLRNTTTWAHLSDTDFIQFNLMAAPGKSGFYEKLGFYKREESNGFGMVMRLNAN